MKDTLQAICFYLAFLGVTGAAVYVAGYILGYYQLDALIVGLIAMEIGCATFAMSVQTNKE